MCVQFSMRNKVLQKKKIMCHGGVGSGGMSEEPGLMGTFLILFFFLNQSLNLEYH